MARRIIVLRRRRFAPFDFQINEANAAAGADWRKKEIVFITPSVKRE